MELTLAQKKQAVDLLMGDALRQKYIAEVNYRVSKNVGDKEALEANKKNLEKITMAIDELEKVKAELEATDAKTD